MEANQKAEVARAFKQVAEAIRASGAQPQQKQAPRPQAGVRRAA